MTKDEFVEALNKTEEKVKESFPNATFSYPEKPEIQDFKPEIWISAGAACIIIACSFLVFSLITGHIVINIAK